MQLADRVQRLGRQATRIKAHRPRKPDPWVLGSGLAGSGLATAKFAP